MPHVDEGTLHALLDGALRSMEPERADAVEAHLAVCRDCAALAEEAAAVRGEAADVLGLLEVPATPDFDEVLVRAGAAGGARHRLARQARWTRGVAWAATIVIALGTGYVIRDRLVPERAASFATEAISEEGTDVGAAEPGVTEPGVTEPGRAAGQGAGTEGALAERQVEQPASREVQTARSDARTEADAAPSAASATMERQQEPPMPAPHLEIAAAPAPAPGTPVARSAAAMADAPSVQGSVAYDEIVVTGSAVVPTRRAVTLEEAESLLGAPLLVLPGASMGQTYVEESGERPVVVSLQRLEGGAEILVTQGPRLPPAGAGARAAEEALRMAPFSSPAKQAVAGHSRVRLMVGGAELILEGPLPVEALRALGEGAVARDG